MGCSVLSLQLTRLAGRVDEFGLGRLRHMNSDTAKKLKDKIVALIEEMSQLEAQRDEIVDQRIAAATPEERIRCSGRAGRVMAALSDVQSRVDAAKRLLARGDGDEYDFVKR